MIIIGGASRGGKGMLSRSLLKQLSLPYLSIDPIKMALAKAVPSYELNTDGTDIEICNQLWPYLSALMKNMIETDLDYIVEGEILPKHAAEFKKETDSNVIICFTGYADISVDEKIHQIEANNGFPNEWTSDISAKELKYLVSQSIKFSQYLRDECEQYQLAYFDSSFGFMTTQENMQKYVVEQFGKL